MKKPNIRSFLKHIRPLNKKAQQNPRWPNVYRVTLPPEPPTPEEPCEGVYTHPCDLPPPPPPPCCELCTYYKGQTSPEDW